MIIKERKNQYYEISEEEAIELISSCYSDPVLIMNDFKKGIGKSILPIPSHESIIFIKEA